MPPPRSPRRPGLSGGRLSERDGPRSVLLLCSPERKGRQGERDDPRASPSMPRQGRMLECQRCHGRYRNENDGPRLHKFEEASQQDYDNDQIGQSEKQYDEAIMEGVQEVVVVEDDGGEQAMVASVAMDEDGDGKESCHYRWPWKRMVANKLLWACSAVMDKDGNEESVLCSFAVEEDGDEQVVVASVAIDEDGSG